MTDTSQYLIRYLGRQMLCGVIEHCSADAVFTACAMQYVNIHASLTALPKCFVVSQVGKGHGLVAQLGVHRHHCRSASQREYFGVRPTGACQSKCHVLDALGQSQTAEVWMNDKA